MTTKCAFPPELDDKQLLRYLDGEADEETISHLKGCAHCREKAETLDRLQKRLTSQLYRLTCPSSIELGEYHLHMLPASQMLLIGQHVRQCPHCRREVAGLEDFLIEPAQQTRLLKPIKVLIARLLSGKEADQEHEDFSSAPAFAGLRGEGEEPLIYQADKLQIVIEVQHDVEEIGLKTLLGLVTGLESNGFTIQASQEGKIITTSSIDENGNFLIDHLAPGLYELILLGPETEIHIQSFTV